MDLCVCLRVARTPLAPPRPWPLHAPGPWPLRAAQSTPPPLPLHICPAAQKSGLTALSIAAEEGHVEIVHALLDAGADDLADEKTGATALHLAALDGHIDVMRALLRTAAGSRRADAPNGGGEVRGGEVRAASCNGHEEAHCEGAAGGHGGDEGGGPTCGQSSHSSAVRNIWRPDLRGASVLVYACRGGHTAALELLLGQPAAMDQVNVVDADSSTPLLAACRVGNMEMVKVLLAHGAHVNMPADGEAGSLRGSPALAAAAECGHAALVRTLCRHKASVDAVDDKGRTPLHAACGGGHAAAARALLSAGAAVDAVGAGSTSLMVAAKEGFSAVCSVLLASHADPDAVRRKDSMTPLMMAARGGHSDAVIVLLKACKRIDAVREKDGETALLVACKNGEADVAALLLAAGASPKTRSKPTEKATEGLSAHDYAASNPELASIFDDAIADTQP